MRVDGCSGVRKGLALYLVDNASDDDYDLRRLYRTYVRRLNLLLKRAAVTSDERGIRERASERVLFIKRGDPRTRQVEFFNSLLDFRGDGGLSGVRLRRRPRASFF